MEAVVLVYGLDGRDFKKLKELLTSKNVRVRRVLPEEYGRAVGSFCGMRTAATDEENAAVSKPMLVFCGCTENITNNGANAKFET